MSALESEKKELLGKRGIDDGTVRLRLERISEGERRIAEAEGFRDIVAEYQNWKRDSWSRLDSSAQNSSPSPLRQRTSGRTSAARRQSSAVRATSARSLNRHSPRASGSLTRSQAA